MKSTKSQVTMFILIGLSLFILVGLVIYISKSSIKKASQQNIRKAQEAGIDIVPIKEFVNACVENLASEAVLTLGKQGGYLYKSQGGTLMDYNDEDFNPTSRTGHKGSLFINYEGFDVTYNIFAPSSSIVNPDSQLSYDSVLPNYPWGIFPFKSNSYSDKTFEGYFGINNMPPLEQGPHSIKSQIESYIDNNLGKCADFSSFEEQGFQVMLHEPKTSVMIGEKDVSVNTKAKLEISRESLNEFSETGEFSTKINLRLKDIYYFAYSMIDRDIKNIEFRISDAKMDNVLVEARKDAYNKDDIIIVTDKESSIKGNQFQYIFARKNRAPALHYILFPKTVSSPITNEKVIEGISAYDPDEDILSISAEKITEAKYKIAVRDNELTDYQEIEIRVS